jgi:hypothetical protein
MPLLSPAVQNSTAVLADWLELNALLAGAQGVGRSAIEAVYRVTSEESEVRRQEDSAGVREDGEISEASRDELVLSIVAEIEWRQRALKQAYPFKLTKKSGRWGGTWRLEGPSSITSRANAPYLICLMIVGLRRGMVSVTDRNLITNHKLGILFQVCACIAIGGYFSAEVASFGWPRSTGDSFFPALKKAWDRIGFYKIVEAYPAGAPDHLKDGGLDLIAWKNFSDNRLAARLILFGQVASGDNWSDKSARLPSDTFVGSFFNGYAPKAWITATIIPFVAHEDMSEEGSLEDQVTGKMAFHEQAHGLLLDRIRVASGAFEALQSGVSAGSIEGLDRLDELTEWLDRLVVDIGAARTKKSQRASKKKSRKKK